MQGGQFTEIGTERANVPMQILDTTNRKMRIICSATLIVATAVHIPAFAQVSKLARNNQISCKTDDDNKTRVKVDVVFGGMRAPTAFAFLPRMDSTKPPSILITLRTGELLLLTRTSDKSSSYKSRPVLISPRVLVYAQIAGDNKKLFQFKGMHDVAVDPDFLSNRYVYLTFDLPDSVQVGDVKTSRLVMGRGKLAKDRDPRDEDRPELMDFKIVFKSKRGVLDKVITQDAVMLASQGVSTDEGSSIVGLPSGRMAFIGKNANPDGKKRDLAPRTLLISVGDSVRQPHDPVTHGPSGGSMAQDGDSDLGKIIILKSDGTDPVQYSKGHRNISGLLYDEDKERVLAIEHGPVGGDELNIVTRAMATTKPNFGYPDCSYGVTNDNGVWRELRKDACTPKAKDGFIEPAFVWGKNNLKEGILRYSIAPSGLAIYHGAYTFDSSGDKKYTGELKYPNWKGNIFVGAMTRSSNVKTEETDDKIGAIRRLRECDGKLEERQIIQIQRTPPPKLPECIRDKSKCDRIRDVRIGPDGYIYAIRHRSDDVEDDGQLIRLLPRTGR